MTLVLCMLNQTFDTKAFGFTSKAKHVHILLVVFFTLVIVVLKICFWWSLGINWVQWVLNSKRVITGDLLDLAWLISNIVLGIIFLTIFMDHFRLSQITLELGKEELMNCNVDHRNTFLLEFCLLFAKTADVHDGGSIRLLEDVTTL